VYESFTNKSVTLESTNFSHFDNNQPISLCKSEATCHIFWYGLHMSHQKDFDIELVMQFFAIVHFGTDDHLTLTWMTRNQKKFAPLARFDGVLCYDYSEGVGSGWRFHFDYYDILRRMRLL
jgi:hypothetical protein